MKKTYATSMPNHIGAFLKASQCFAVLGINITRVSYDKSVDSHMLFLDVEGTEAQIRQADAELEKIGFSVRYGRNTVSCDAIPQNVDAAAVADMLGARAEVTSLGDSIKLKGKAEGFEILTLDRLN